MIGIPEDIELTEKFRRLVQLFNNTEEKLYCPDYCKITLIYIANTFII